MTTNPQKLVTYIHHQSKLFYVGSYNMGPDFEKLSDLNRFYARGKEMMKKLNNDETPRGLSSGFAMAIINTDFQGWERIEGSEVYDNPTQSAAAKEREVISLAETTGYQFVGAHLKHVKGIAGTSDIPQGWTRKWNVGAMTHAKIRSKIDFIVRSILDVEIPPAIYNHAYMAVVCPDTNGPRQHNFGGYNVDCFANMFRFVRNYVGKDLP